MDGEDSPGVFSPRRNRGEGVALCVREQQECMELCPGMDNEPVKSIWVGKQTDVGDVVVGVCYRPLHEEAEAEALFRELEEASCLQAMVLTGDFNPCDICWRDSTAGCKQSRRFLECSGNNFLTQVIKEPRREDTLMDIIPINTEELVRDVKDEGSLSCREHDMVEFRVLREGSRAKNRITNLDSGEQTLAS